MDLPCSHVCFVHVKSLTRCAISEMQPAQVLLAKYSSEEDVVIGTPYANRDMAEVQGLLGCFVKCVDSPYPLH